MSELSHEDQRAHAVASKLRDIAGAIREVLMSELGDAYDCVRAWDAWSYGTMTQDDFIPVTDRVDDLVEAIQKKLGGS
jgi:hypothetical protein